MLTDQPITTAKDDLLGRKAFAQQLASAMLSCRAVKRSSFTFGLLGSFGSGRTSILNMVDEALHKRKLLGKKVKPTPLVFRFNPWQYPSADMLPQQFLRMLYEALLDTDAKKSLRKAGKAIKQYAKALDGATVDGIPAWKTESVAELRNKKQPKKKKKLPKSVLQKKKKVDTALRKQKRKLYILVDDLDRLSPKRICATLQLLSTIANFPQVVYVVTYDGAIVQDAIATECRVDGSKYLEKCMQVQLSVPLPPSERMQTIFHTYVKTWCASQQDINFDPAYYAEIAPFLFSCITNMRDMYRFTNTFRTQYQMLGNEVNFVDLLAMTALQLHIPQTLLWMQEHRDDLLRGGGLCFRGANTMEKQRLKREHRRMIQALCASCEKTLLPMLGHMFPRYGRNVLDVYDDTSDMRYMRLRRICCEEYFDLYFTLSTDTLVITRKEIVQSIQELDTQALRSFTGGMHAGKRNAYVCQLQHYLDDIPDARLPLFFHEVLWLSHQAEPDADSGKPQQRSYFQECCVCASLLLSEMKPEQATHCLQQAVKDANTLTIPMLVVLLEQGQIPAKGLHPAANQYTQVDEAWLDGLRQQLVEAIRMQAQSYNWLTSFQPLPVLRFWKDREPGTYLPVFAVLMQEDRNVARLVSCVMHHFGQGANREYQYGDMHGQHVFSDQITQVEAVSAILRLQGTEAFLGLSTTIQQDCIALSLMDPEYTRVSQTVVSDALPAWKIKNGET